MPFVTDIKRQRKRENRFSVYVDGTYEFALEDLELSASNLRVGLELTAADVAEWRAQAASGKAYNAALSYISYRQRSLHEVQTYLVGKEYDDETVQATIERLTNLGLINDEAFARAWIGERMRLRPRSRRILGLELYKKGLDIELIKRALDELGRDDELTALKHLVLKKAPRYPDQAKLIQYLGSQGYSYGLIKEAMQDAELPDED